MTKTSDVKLGMFKLQVKIGQLLFVDIAAMVSHFCVFFVYICL